MTMGASPAPASSRRHSVLGLAVPALWIASLLFAPGRVWGQFRLFDLGGGADYLSELQKSLTISSSLGTVTIRDPQDGGTVTGPLNGDPRLLNRKFDIEWQMTGPGVRVPFTLSTPRILGRAAIQPRLTLEALDGDFDLRFLNQRETGPDDSLHGKGPMYGVELALATGIPGSPWFAETGYRFHSLPSTNAERSQPFTLQGASVLLDESRLSRETHDAFAIVGYETPEGLRTYTGVRYRKANVEVRDDLRFVDSLQQETTLSTRTRLDGSATEAIVGVEGQRRFRGSSFLGRAEVTFSERDYGVLATVVFAGQLKPPPSPSGDPEIEKAARIAEEIAPQIVRIRDEFEASRRNLPTVSIPGIWRPAYLAEPLLKLLDKTEEDLLNALSGHIELIGLQDYVRDLFDRVRSTLQFQPYPRTSSLDPKRPLLAILLRPSLFLEANLQTTKLIVTNGDSAGSEISRGVNTLARLTSQKHLTQNFCFASKPGSGVKLSMYYIRDMRAYRDIKTAGPVLDSYRGLYHVKAERSGYDTAESDLDLVSQSPPIVSCKLVANGGKGKSLCRPAYWYSGKACPNT